MSIDRRCGLASLAPLLLGLALVSGCATAPAEGPSLPPPSKEPRFELPALRLPTPGDAAERNYLGLDPGETFALADVRTRILVIEVFNFYCPHCQAEAPNINRLHERIENDERFRGRIKIIGIGISNTAYEVDRFRRLFAIRFPLFADRSRVISRQLGVRQTPTFIAWNYRFDGRMEPILFAPGPIDDIERFLDRLIRASDLNTS